MKAILRRECVFTKDGFHDRIMEALRRIPVELVKKAFQCSYRYMWLYRAGNDGMGAFRAARRVHTVNRQLRKKPAAVDVPLSSDEEEADQEEEDEKQWTRLMGQECGKLSEFTVNALHEGRFDASAWLALRKVTEMASSPVRRHHEWSQRVTKTVQRISRRWEITQFGELFRARCFSRGESSNSRAPCTGQNCPRCQSLEDVMIKARAAAQASGVPAHWRM